jgi:hypothetical protein
MDFKMCVTKMMLYPKNNLFDICEATNFIKGIKQKHVQSSRLNMTET